MEMPWADISKHIPVACVQNLYGILSTVGLFPNQSNLHISSG